MAYAMVFPGQGSQSVGMMAGYGNVPVIRATFDEASSTLGQDLWTLAQDGPPDLLAQTVNTQPLMLTAGIAVWRYWVERGGKPPIVLAGHSLGEYSALVASGALSFSDAVPLVRLRALAMQDAVPAGEGAMAAVLGLDNVSLQAACVEAAQGECVEAVNFNATGQTVIAGHKAAVERAANLCKLKGAKRTVILPVSAPFHSGLMRPASVKLAQRLSEIEIRTPAIPVVNNVDVAIEFDPNQIRDALVRQAYSPVRWVETIQKISTLGATSVVECGPGKVLSSLTKRCAEGLASLSLVDSMAVDAAVTSLE